MTRTGFGRRGDLSAVMWNWGKLHDDFGSSEQAVPPIRC